MSSENMKLAVNLHLLTGQDCFSPKIILDKPTVNSGRVAFTGIKNYIN